MAKKREETIDLKRMSACEPITNAVLDWNSVSDAALYFKLQGLRSFEVLHVLEIESCEKLMCKLQVSKLDFVSLLESQLSELEIT